MFGCKIFIVGGIKKVIVSMGWKGEFMCGSMTVHGTHGGVGSINFIGCVRNGQFLE